MKRPWAILPLVACSSIYCGSQSGPRTPGGEDAPPSLLVRSAPETSGPLAFPPAHSGRRQRGAMPDDFSGAREDGPPRVVEPALDGDATIDMVEGKLRLVFSAPMARARPAKPNEPVDAEAGTLRFTPALAGDARWIDGHTLEFVAKAPPAIGKTFELELGPVKGADGSALAQPVKAKAITRASVAGKVLSYVPQTGLPRVIVVRPNTEKVGRMPKLSALFDQPIELAMARALLRLEDEKGKAIPFVVDHPKSPSFEGIKLDPRFVVLVSPRQPLVAGASYTFRANDRVQPADVEPKSASFEVAARLTHSEVRCGWNEGDTCEVTAKRIRTGARELHVLYNNPLEAKDGDLKKNVSVTPAVKNLYVRSYGYEDGRLIVSGAFEASTTYTIQIGGLVDIFGGKLAAPTLFTLETAPVGASATIPEGIVTLDHETSKRFRVVSRNVKEVELSAWPIARGDADALEKAIARVRARDIPSDTPHARIKVAIKPVRDQLVDTSVDLLDKLEADRPHLITARVMKTAFDADLLDMPRHSEASRPPVALVTPASPNALAVHARTMPDATLVHVARLGTGEPVAGASLTFLSTSAAAGAPVTTDASGIALLRGPPGASVLRVKAQDAEATLSLSHGGKRVKDMFPELGIGAGASASLLRGVLLTDRGIYRPGSTLFAKTFVKKADGDRIVAAPDAKVKVEIVGPTGDELSTEDAKLDASGGWATRVAIPGDAKLGRYQILVHEEGREDAIAQQIVQVAEFEPPRFAVDVDATATPDRRFDAKVRARYLFGAPMDGGNLAWTLKREPAPMAAGPLTEAGLVFRRRVPDWYDEKREEPWLKTGEAKLGADGSFAIAQAVPLAGTVGPQLVTLEADVSDSSHRHIANRGSVVLHTAARYAGIRLKEHWLPVGSAVPIELGVVGPDGKPIEGATVAARVTRIDYHYVTRRGAGGALRSEWTTRRSDAGRCTAKSAKTPVSCSVTLPSSSDYEIAAEVDGQAGGSVRVFAWREGDRTVKPAPRRGRAIEIVADKSRYMPGETAKLMVHSPFAAATAILTVEQGGLLEHRTVRVDGSVARFELPITPAHAPHVHAAVTLLPAAKDGGRAPADYRIGALRVPVALSGSRLDLALATSKPSYAPGDEAEVQIEVRDAGQPQANADVVLAVVDEGVLRLTNFRQPDPVAALRPGRALDFEARDSREALAELLERSHVAGDGGGETVSSARKSFVETALWRPDIKTDASGRATVRFKLPDNLTEFRVMALALDDEGKGVTGETEFTVKKPVMIVPVVPRFAAVGDEFEAAAMVHNETDNALAAKVTIDSRTLDVDVPAHGKTRVALPFVAGGDSPHIVLAMSVRSSADGPPLDSVEAKIPVQTPGIAERPRVEGSFAKHQQIDLDVPDDVRAEAGSEGFVKVAVGQHVWPELGARLDYLLGYPHGCVEQTTSSTLPLLAARDILPRIGVARWGDAELKKKIEAGLARLASMKTASGGLGYWPGDDNPNVYGTAYAMRAVVIAKRTGIAPPRGLLEGMRGYLADHLVGKSLEPEVQAAIAQSLAELAELPPSSADALWDRRAEQTAFGLASLAVALSTLPGQDDRVATLLDDLEASFDADAKLVRPAAQKDFHYFGSNTRTTAQVAMALTRLRRSAKVLPRLLSSLAGDLDSYTTQATAYSLLALAQHLTDARLRGSDVRVLLDGAVLAAARDLGHGSREYSIPLAAVRGKRATLRLESAVDDAIGFMVQSSWRRPASAIKGLAATSSGKGPEVWRVYTDAKGKPVDLAAVRAGDVLRVAVLTRVPHDLHEDRKGYLAVTDRLPGGFEPIQPDLATVASVPELEATHPLAEMLRWSENTASHVEMHDDRVDLYFDRIWGGFVAATYLVRATTPGTFALPPASAELMYEGDSHGYTEAAKVIIQ